MPYFASFEFRCGTPTLFDAAQILNTDVSYLDSQFGVLLIHAKRKLYIVLCNRYCVTGKDINYNINKVPPMKSILPALFISTLVITYVFTETSALGSPPIGGMQETAGSEAVVELPPLEISASAPLIKVNEWKMLEARFAPAAVIYEDYIYIVGGANASAPSLNSIERVNILTGKTEHFAKLEIPRLWHQVVAWDRKLYVLGGDSRFANYRRVERSMEVIDLDTREVKQGKRMPINRRGFGSAIVDGKIFVIGGRYESNGRFYTTNRVAIFDIENEIWSAGPPMPTLRSCCAVLVDGGFIVVPGGYGRGQQLDVVEVLNTRTGVWSTLPRLSRPRSAHAAAFLGSNIFLFGDYYETDEILAYNLISKESTIHWLSYRKARHSGIANTNEKVYIIGGISEKDGAASDIIQVYKRPTSNL